MAGQIPLCAFLESPFNNRPDFGISSCFWIIINTGLKEALRAYEAHPLILGRAVPRPSKTNDCLLYFLIYPREGDSLNSSKNIFQHLTKPYSQGILILISLKFQLISSFYVAVCCAAGHWFSYPTWPLFHRIMLFHIRSYLSPILYFARWEGGQDDPFQLDFYFASVCMKFILFCKKIYK